jgi:Guanylylate cyclase
MAIDDGSNNTGFLSELWKSLKDRRRDRYLSSDGVADEKETVERDLPPWLRQSLVPVVVPVVPGKHAKKHTTTPADAAMAASFKAIIPHIRQEFDWDCGIACLEMALEFCVVVPEPESSADSQSPSSRILRAKTRRNWLEARIGTRSTWTIDLVDLLDCLLRNRDELSVVAFDYLFCSQQLSVNPALATMGYYSHSFTADATRVNDKYNSLKTHSAHRLLQHDDLSLETILTCVRHDNCLVILLVDNTIFQATIQSSDERTRPSSHDCTFIGHYILLVRCIGNDKVLVHDPGRPNPITVQRKLLESAWRVPGTDSDVIVVVRYGNYAD